MRSLVVNLTRFGDLLQSQAVFHGLTGFAGLGGHARSGRGPVAALLCLENFAPATALLGGVDQVLPLRGGRMLARLAQDWREGLGEVRELVREAAAFRPERIINLTATLPARLITRAIAQEAGKPGAEPEVVGFGLDEYGFGLLTNRWSLFLLASTRTRGLSPFNIVDLFHRAADLPDLPRSSRLNPPDPARTAQLAERLATLVRDVPGAGQTPRFVGLQLGASDDKRRWPVAAFASLGRKLLRDGYVPVLLGSDVEAQLAERYAEAGGPGVSLVGETDLPELAAVVSLLELLVTNDTGTMHLAAGLGVPCLAFFLATAQPWDTGPYGSGHLCLEPDTPCHPCPFHSSCGENHACRQTIRPEAVHLLAAKLLQPEQGAGCCIELTDDELRLLNGVRVWETMEGAGGAYGHFQDLRCLTRHEATDRTRWIRLQRALYRRFLDQEGSESGETLLLAPGSLSGLERHGLELSSESRATLLTTLAEARGLLTLLDGQARLLAARPTETAKQKFLTTWTRVQALFDGSPHLGVLGYLWLSESQEIPGQDLGSIQALVARYLALVETLGALLER